MGLPVDKLPRLEVLNRLSLGMEEGLHDITAQLGAPTDISALRTSCCIRCSRYVHFV
jgi:hypothetical protein